MKNNIIFEVYQGKARITLIHEKFSVSGSSALLCAYLARWLAYVEQHGICTIKNEHNPEEHNTVVLVRRRITRNDPQFTEVILKQLQRLFGASNIQISSQQKRRQEVENSIRRTLTNSYRTPELEPAVAQIVSVLPKLSFQQLSELSHEISTT